MNTLPSISSDSSCAYHGHSLNLRLGLTHDQCLLFEPCDFSLVRGSITGLVGTNGAGKTSLAKTIASGQIPGFPSNELSVQYVSSHENYAFDEEEHAASRPRAYAMAIVEEKLTRLNEEIARLEDRLGEEGDGGDVEELANRLAEMYDVQEELETSSAKEIQSALEELGFARFLDLPISQLSCGWRYKCRLAAAFSSRPDVLIFDEPSFLDDASTEWLVRKCRAMARKANAMAMVISHKASLLSQLCDRFLHINSATHRLTLYNCDYETFCSTHEARIHQAERQLELHDAKLQTAESSLQSLQSQLHRREKNAKKIAPIDRRFTKGKNIEAKQKADKSSAAKLRQLKNDMAELEQVKLQAHREQVKQLKVEGTCGSGTLVLFQTVTFAYSPHAPYPLLHELDARIEATDRILLRGPNGCGKTTFLKLVVGELQPDQGLLTRKSDALYFPQTALIELTLHHGDQTAMEYLGDQLTMTAARCHLGEYGIAHVAHRPIVALSAGQRVRLWLAKQLLGSRKPSLLVLDEVSENLDKDSKKTLLDVLNSFVGAVIVVSHDVDFCDSLRPTQVWTMANWGRFRVTFPD